MQLTFCANTRLPISLSTVRYVADNISSITGDYYARRTLTYVLGANDPLLEAHRKRKRSRDTDNAEQT